MALRKGRAGKTAELPTMRGLMERRGLTVAQLAERSGYTPEHIRRVMRGDHPGSRKFHAFMEEMLGGKYRTGGQLTFDRWSFDRLFPEGVRGHNTIDKILKAQGITGPQPWPKRPKYITDEDLNALDREIEEMRRKGRELARERFERGEG